MRFHVFRYLSKPLDVHRFFRNMKEAVSLYNTMTIKVPIETKQGIHTLPASAIIMVEAFRRKVVVHTTMRDFDSIHNMQYWMELLPKNCFFQTHRSFIVNFEHIVDFDHTLIHMTGGQFRAYLTIGGIQTPPKYFSGLMLIIDSIISQSLYHIRGCKKSCVYG